MKNRKQFFELIMQQVVAKLEWLNRGAANEV